jgi:hypothetical protein
VKPHEHPDYPKTEVTVWENGMRSHKGPSPEALKAFYDAHPEFWDIPQMTSVCCYCGDPQGSKMACCGENHFEDVELGEE